MGVSNQLVLTVNELFDNELNLRTDNYLILVQESRDLFLRIQLQCSCIDMVRLDTVFCGGGLCCRYCLNLIISLLYVYKHGVACRINTIVVHVNSGCQHWIINFYVLRACKYVQKKVNIRNIDVANFFCSMIVDFLII